MLIPLIGQIDCGLEQVKVIRIPGGSLVECLQYLSTTYQLPLTYSPNRIPDEQVAPTQFPAQALGKSLAQFVGPYQLELSCMAGKLVVHQAFQAKVAEPPVIPSQTLRGRVIDEDSRIGIPFAAVILPGTHPLRGSYSDENGYFRIENVQVGRFLLEARHVEFEQWTEPDLLVSSSKEVRLEIRLRRKINVLETVTITNETALVDPLNPFETNSYQRYQVEEAERYPASYGDPARHALAYAGLVGQNDIRNELVIRGNNPRGVQWRLDGVEIPNPNHFAREGTASGSVSAISSNLLADSEFLTGAFPAQYGNVMAGVFDLRVRNGNDSLFEHSIELGTLGLEVASEGPFARKKGYKGSYLVNYRSSVLNIIGTLFDTVLVDEELTNYQDLAIKLHFPTQRGSWDYVGVLGNSRSGLPTDERRRNRLNNEVGINLLTYRRTLGDDAYLKTSLAVMGTGINNQVFDKDSLALYEQRERTNKLYLRTNWLFHKRFSDRWIGEIGGVISLEGFVFRGWMGSNQYPSPYNDWVTFDSAGMVRTNQWFVNAKYRSGPRSEWVFGLHLVHHQMTRERLPEPRVGFRLGLNERNRLRMGLGFHSRRSSLLYYLHLDPQQQPYNTNLKVPKAFHAVLGYDFLPGPNWAFVIETYFQFLYALPVATDSTLSGFATLLQPEGYYSGKLVNQGIGYNQGLEISLHRRFAQGWYLLTTGSLYQSVYLTGSGGLRSTPYDGPLQFSLLAGREIAVGKKGKPHLLSLNGKFFFNNQQRLQVLDPDQYLQTNRYFQNFALANCASCSYKPYWRLDLQLVFRRNHKRSAGVWRLDIQNITRRQNLRGIVYDPQEDKIFELFHLRLLPILSYKFEF